MLYSNWSDGMPCSKLGTIHKSAQNIVAGYGINKITDVDARNYDQNYALGFNKGHPRLLTIKCMKHIGSTQDLRIKFQYTAIKSFASFDRFCSLQIISKIQRCPAITFLLRHESCWAGIYLYHSSSNKLGYQPSISKTYGARFVHI